MISISGYGNHYKNLSGFEDLESYLTINCCGYQKIIKTNVNQLRQKGRVDYYIIYLINGRGFYNIHGEMVEISAGNIIIYKPKEPQHYMYHFMDCPEIYWIHFTGYGNEEILKEAEFEKDKIYRVGIDNECIELYKKIIYELQVKRPKFAQFANAYFFQIIANFSRLHKEYISISKTSKSSDLEEVIKSMHSEYHKAHSVEHFALQCNLSTYRFIHNFKNHTGMPPIAYLTKIRLDKAKELLLTSNLTITEIANLVGYENPLYFSRMFSKNVKFSPSEFRRKYGEE